MKRTGRYALALLLTVACVEAHAAGSWVANAAETRVSMAGRETSSDSLGPVGVQAGNQVIQSIVWHYRLPPGDRLNVRLCHPAGCTPLPGPRGTTRALAGLPADVALEFRFSLPEGHRPVTVSGLQVIVNHR